jgi:hypothetical protein
MGAAAFTGLPPARLLTNLAPTERTLTIPFLVCLAITRTRSRVERSHPGKCPISRPVEPKFKLGASWWRPKKKSQMSAAKITLNAHSLRELPIEWLVNLPQLDAP